MAKKEIRLHFWPAVISEEFEGPADYQLWVGKRVVYSGAATNLREALKGHYGSPERSMFTHYSYDLRNADPYADDPAPRRLPGAQLMPA
jgi:hypothetical protein